MRIGLPRIDYLLIDLIASCNLNCLHCRASGFDKKSKLHFYKFREIIEDAKRLGVKTITFSGGEPFLREDIFKLIELVKKNGFISRVQSNILLLDKKKIKKLKEIGVDYIGTGIDGLKKNHDKLRNKKGSFEKVIKNIILLKQNSIKVHVEFTATNFNFKDFEKVMRLCEKLGVYDVMTRAVLPSGKGKKSNFALTKKEYESFLRKVIGIQKGKINIKLYCQDPVSIYLDKERIKKLKDIYKNIKNKKIIGGCSAGINMIYISPQGDVRPCSFLEYSFGNIYENSLYNIVLSNVRKMFLKKQLSRNFNEKCKNCKIRFLCGGCRARALDFNKDMWGKDPFCFKEI